MDHHEGERMKRRVLIPIVCLVMAALFSCSSTLSYEMKDVRQSYGGCRFEPYTCTYFIVRYPEITRSPSERLREALRQEVTNFLLHTGTYQGTTVEDAMRGFFNDYEKVRKDFPDTRQVWFIEKNVSVVYQSRAVVSLSRTDVSFLGGAHPNSHISYINFDVRTGAVLALPDILRENGLQALHEIAEKKFRTERKIGPRDSLKEHGYWFPDNRFSVGDNFACTEKGLKLYFNPYEIAPYSMGPTEILLPYGEIQHIVKRHLLPE